MSTTGFSTSTGGYYGSATPRYPASSSASAPHKSKSHKGGWDTTNTIVLYIVAPLALVAIALAVWCFIDRNPVEKVKVENRKSDGTASDEIKMLAGTISISGIAPASSTGGVATGTVTVNYTTNTTGHKDSEYKLSSLTSTEINKGGNGKMFGFNTDKYTLKLTGPTGVFSQAYTTVSVSHANDTEPELDILANIQESTEGVDFAIVAPRKTTGGGADPASPNLIRIAFQTFHS